MQKIGLLLGFAALTASAQYQGIRNTWIEPGTGEKFPSAATFDNIAGTLGVINALGDIDTKDHPFFTALGTNGRACVNCHQPTYGMSISAASMIDRWLTTDGKDPVFAAFDGSNCPNLPQDKQASHSLLIDRGLYRIPLAWPPRNADGSVKPVEFSIEVMRDPTGCNTSRDFGLTAPTPTLSVYRRPRPAVNLKYVLSGAEPIVRKTGMPADIDPETGKPVAMNLMADAREATLKTQAMSAIMGHEQASTPPTREQLEQIVEFESQVYAAQAAHIWGGALVQKNGPAGLGPVALADRQPGGESTADSIFGRFANWKGSDYYRSSVARGAEIFMGRQFWIRDTANLNTTGVGNPVKHTCATCHNSPMTGQDVAAGWMDIGTTTYPTWTETGTLADAGELPVFKITCSKDAAPHPYLGRVIYTTDPGRAMISGRCADVGSIVMQQLRGLAARPPYFANGSAKTLRDVVDFYDRRYDMKLTDAEKEDLVNFLGVL